MTAAQPLLWSGYTLPPPDDYNHLLIGAIGNGWALTYVSASPDDTLSLWDVSGATPSIADSVVLSGRLVKAPGRPWGEEISNDEGVIAIIRDPALGSNSLDIVTRSGSALTVTSGDTVAATPDDMLVAGDGSAIFTSTGTPRVFRWYDSAGAIASTWSTGLGTVAGRPVYCPTMNRIVTLDNSTGTLTLYDETGTALSTESVTEPDSSWWTACGRRRVVYTSTFDNDITYRALDTTGDALAWLDAEQAITTDWTTDGSTGQWRGSLAFISYAEGSVYWVDPVAQTFAASAAAADAQDVACCGPRRTFASGSLSSTWNLWGIDLTRPRYLRQRQSPRQSIRVGNDLLLRQRQRWT